MKLKTGDILWVVTFLIFLFAVYEQASHRVVRSTKRLERKKAEITLALEKEEKLYQEQRLKIDSQNDPKWIELELIHRLGLVPDGYKKIYIEAEKPPQS